MNRTRKPTSTALDPELLNQVEKWIEGQNPPPTKTWVFETALKEFLGKRSESCSS